MRLIHPTPIGAAQLVSASIPENDAPAYNPATTYPQGAVVMHAHRRFESVVAGNVGIDPTSAAAAGKWLDLGPTNLFAMFDGEVGTVTVAGQSLTLELTPGAIDSLAFVETQAERVVVRMVSNGNLVYERTVSFEAGGRAIRDWWAYFTAPIGRRTNLILDDLPIYSDAVLTITLYHETAVKCGVLIVGNRFRLGATMYRPKISIDDFSKKTTTDYGSTTVVKRAFRKKMSANIQCGSDEIDELQRKLAEVRALPCLFIGDGKFDALTIYGFYKSFEIDLAYPDVSYCSISVEGLI